MKYFWTFLWTFVLVNMVTYVAGSMIGVPYNLATATILSIGAAILISIITLVVPVPSTENK